MSIPKLRFREFSGEWEPHLLKNNFSKITTKNKGNIISNVISNSAKNGLVRQVDYFLKDIANKQNTDGYYIIQKNDFVYNPRKSTEAPYGPVSIYTFEEEGIVSPLYLCFRPQMSICTEFFSSYFKSPKWYKYIYFTGDSGARHDRVSIKDSDFLQLPVNLPPLPEQQKIADFLSIFDEKIENQQNIIKNLERQKKGYMQKIFSRELRFKEQNGNDFPQWEEKKLGEVCEMIGGGTPSKQVEEFWTGSIPWISSSDITDHSIKNIAISRYITENAISKSATKLCPKGTICIVSRVGVGKLAVTNEELCTSQDFTNITRFEGNILFLAYLLSMRMKMEAEKTQGTSIKGITVNEIKTFFLLLPTLPEQQKIADFLSAFDEKIETEKQILTHLQNTKKGLLQQMFC